MYRLIFFLLNFLIFSLGIKVQMRDGAIIGTKAVTVFDGRHYYAFYGVPYAAPPTGQNRFKDPQPVKKRNKPFDATTEYHGACAQAHIVHKHAKYGVENCLYLNIHTTHVEPSTLKPVIVWYHGHAFTASFSHVFGADFFIDNDIVFVSVSYRIGVFGFVKLNETAHANMGLKDIVKSLKWIRKNIKKFGGDKNRVTVMGNGSAANYISLLLLTKWKNLFSKMILQSGSVYSPSIFSADPDKESMKLLKDLRIKASKNITKATSKEVLAASSAIYSSYDIINSQRPQVPFTPVLEGIGNKSLLTSKPSQYLQKHRHFTNDKPILIGFSTQESIPEVIPFIHNPKYLKLFQTFFKYIVPFSDGCSFNYSTDTYGKVSQIIKNFYFKDGINEKSIENFLKYTTDLIKYPIYQFIMAQINAKSKMYVYKFNYKSKFNAIKANSLAGTNVKLKGTAAGDELCYLMRCQPLWDTYVQIKDNTTDRDTLFIKNIVSMWSNFAKFGDPTPKSFTGNVRWPPMTATNKNIMFIDRVNRIVNTDSEDKMYTFWNDIYDKFYADKHCKPNVRDEL